ncbi:Golgi pH regulator [Vanrija pseudolonga]|uniref:Golgi pH regulator n=1 Tax=Vanrija pseudolonga TaxID=143232 RepID=A0AAF0YC65_9TREE|nr:Golgi pH regulator [Vanrija pseudolonga]
MESEHHPAGGAKATLSKAAASHPILFDTLVLVALRVVYALLARRYLLATLNPTLRSLSTQDDVVLPDAYRGNSAATRGLLRESDAELEPESTDAESPSSSYPPSPRSRRAPIQESSAPFRHRSASSVNRTDAPLDEEAAGGGIELAQLSARLRDSGPAPRRGGVQVLELSHGRAASGSTGSKSTKVARRGLSRVARIVFSLAFAESMNIVTLVVFHALGFLHAHARQVNFSVSLHILLGIILLVVPLVQCLLLTYRSRDSTSASTKSSSLPFTSRLLISLIPFALYVFLFTRIPPYITAVAPREIANVNATIPADEASNGTVAGIGEALVEWSTSGPEGWEGGGWLASSLGRVVVLGIVVIAGLSGVGAIVTAWDYLEQARGAGRPPVTDADVLQAERSLYRIRHDIVAKREDIARVSSGGSAEAASGGWMTRANSLRSELQGLQLMESDVMRSLSSLKARNKRQGFRHTIRGAVYNILGYVFALYCAARLAMCLISIFVAPLSTSRIPESGASHKGSGNTNGDWISFAVALGLAHLPFGHGVDVAAWSRAISLLMTGLLILSSLAMVLRWLSRMLRLTSKSVGAGFLLLTLGQLFATYTISLLVQLRSSIPPAPLTDGDPFNSGAGNGTAIDTGGATDDSLLRSLPDFRVFGRLFDAVFLFAAIGAGLYRYIAMKVTGSDDDDLYIHRGEH